MSGDVLQNCILSIIHLTYLFRRFNKRREDFKTLRGYNDYLEEVEDISNPRLKVYGRFNYDSI
jgi:hypothetical protein